jgi:hypothetical protein
VLEEVGRSEPRTVVKGRTPESNLLLGMGYYRPARLVLVFSQGAGSARLQVGGGHELQSAGFARRCCPAAAALPLRRCCPTRRPPTSCPTLQTSPGSLGTT